LSGADKKKIFLHATQPALNGQAIEIFKS